MKLTGVVAIDRNGCMGKGGKIPWHYKEDFQYFKALTTDTTIVMGRKTWDSLPKKPLPNRRNVILTKNWTGALDPLLYKFPDKNIFFSNIESLDGLLRGLKEPHYVIGGAQVFQVLWPYITEFRVTMVKDVVENGDTFIPKQFFSEFRIEENTTMALSENCSVSKYVRI